jgi:hypothetical protein
MAMQPCPICGNPAEFKRVAAHAGWLIDCARCGRHEVTASAWPLMAAASASDRVAALAWARAYNEQHPSLLARPCITTVCFGEIGDARRRR